MKDFFKTLNPSVLFVCAVLCLPGILFQWSVTYLWIDIAFFIFLNFLKKGRVRILSPLIICISVVFFNLFSTEGLVIFSVLQFKVTLGALKNGLHKSGILLAMVFVSQYAVSRDLYFPGKAGGFLSRMFWYFDKLSEKLPVACTKEKETEKKRAKPTGKKTFFTAPINSVFSLIDKTDERLLNVFLSVPEETQAALHLKKAANQKEGAFTRFFFSVLPLFPVYALFGLALFDFYPV